MEYVNRKIIQLLKDCDLSQKQFAFTIGTTPAVVSKWVKGRSTPNMDSIKNICEKLNLPISYFMEDHSEQDMMMNAFDSLILVVAMDQYLNHFHYELKNGDTADFVLMDESKRIIRSFTTTELTAILYEINQAINEKLFYEHKYNFLQLNSLKPLQGSN